jgi:hypothetical protein
MGKLMDFLLGTSNERKNKQRIQKKQLIKQKENNKKMRAFYRKRSEDEINLRRTPKHKVRKSPEKSIRR